MTIEQLEKGKELKAQIDIVKSEIADLNDLRGADIYMHYPRVYQHSSVYFQISEKDISLYKEFLDKLKLRIENRLEALELQFKHL